MSSQEAQKYLYIIYYILRIIYIYIYIYIYIHTFSLKCISQPKSCTHFLPINAVSPSIHPPPFYWNKHIKHNVTTCSSSMSLQFSPYIILAPQNVCSEWNKQNLHSVWIRKTNQMSLFVFFISLLIVAQHVSGNHVPIIRS